MPTTCIKCVSTFLPRLLVCVVFVCVLILLPSKGDQWVGFCPKCLIPLLLGHSSSSAFKGLEIGIWKHSAFPGGLICMIMSPSLQQGKGGGSSGATEGSREVGTDGLAGDSLGKAFSPAPELSCSRCGVFYKKYI